MPRSKKPRKPKNVNFDWEAVVNGVRVGSTQVFNDIYKGAVDEEELEKLQNFVQFALALMHICGPDKWAQAKMNAELLSYLKPQGDPPCFTKITSGPNLTTKNTPTSPLPEKSSYM